MRRSDYALYDKNAYCGANGENTFSDQPSASPYGINVGALSALTDSARDSTRPRSYPQISDALREANVGWVRMDFPWGADLAYDAYKRDPQQIDWRPMDSAVSRALCRGLNVLGILSGTPPWAVKRFGDTVYLHGGNDVPGGYQYQHPWFAMGSDIRGRLMPDSIQMWDDFVRTAVARYPAIRYWAIWNEPNDPRSLLGYNWWNGGGLTAQIAAYDTLVAHAAQWIHNNPDGQGRRNLVALEIAAGDSVAGDFARRFIADQQGRGTVDVLALHLYTREAGGAVDYMQNKLRSIGGFGAWSGEVWLTEVGLQGCNPRSLAERQALGYCTGPSTGSISDAAQAAHLTATIQGMNTGPSRAVNWTKTFYFHSHEEVYSDTVGNNYGILNGARAGRITGRPAYTAYAGIAGPLALDGATYGSNENVAVTASPAVPPPPAGYYYVWEYQFCANTGQAGDCDYQWYPYTSGPGTTVSPYVDESDWWVHVRVRQYAWAGGPQIGDGLWEIQGPGHAAQSCGDQIVCGAGGFRAGAAKRDTAGAAPGSALAAQAHYAPPRVERRKGKGHAGNR